MTLTVSQLLAEKSRLEDVISEAATARTDIRALDTFLSHFGVKVPASPTAGGQSSYKPGSFTCDVEGCGKTYTARSTLSNHTAKVHGIALTTPAGDGTFTCDQCDRNFTTPQGLGSHRRRGHGVAGSSSNSLAGRQGVAK